MIVVNGREYRTLQDVIYANGRQVLEAYVNGQKVYPDDDRFRFAMWFEVPEMVSKYSSTPINRYGAYLKLSSGENLVYRVAWFLNLTTNPFKRKAFISFDGYQSINAQITYVPFVSMDENIIEDGTTNSDINTFVLKKYSSGGKTYYANENNINVNLVDKDGNYIVDFQIGFSTENCRIFHNEEDAVAYVLG